MKLKNSVILSVIFLGIGSFSYAQTGFNWPEDKQTAQVKYTLMTDNLKAKNFSEALPAFRWLYFNAPDLDDTKQSLYVSGAKIYEGMVKQTEDKALKIAYQDSALMMYDERIAHGGDRAYVLNRKCLRVYAYLVNRKDTQKEMYDQYKEAITLNGDKLYRLNARYFMKVIGRNQKAGYMLTDEQIIEDYTAINDVVEANIAKGGDKKADWETVKKDIDNEFASMVTIDCDFINKNWVPQFKENPEDIKLAKKIFAGMLTAKCTDDPAWLEAAEVVNKNEPSYGMNKTLGKMYRSKGEMEKAIQYLNDAETMAESGEEKGDVYYLLAEAYYQKGSKSTARSYATKAASADPSKKEAYILVGNMYFNSYNECQGENIVISRAVYIAAYNWYAKAGASSQMASAKAQFPSIEEIFTYGMKEGDNVKVGCWINESVQLQRRPS